MKEEWKEIELGDVLSSIKGGGTPSKNKSEYWGGDIPWCSVKDMSTDKFTLDSTQDFITELGLKSSSSNLITKGTVVTSTRMGLGRAFISNIDIAINQDLKALYPTKDLDNIFLLLLIIFNRNNLESLGTGSTVKGIKLETLRSLKISLPPLKIQRKIASILSAYDDLIENNLKRIKLLEEIAKRTYEEWFVKMRFPGYENVKFDEVKGFPEGWKNTDLSDYIIIKHGYAYKGKYFKEEETNSILLTPGNFKIGGGIKLDKIKYYDDVAECPSDYILNKHDLLLTMTDLSKMGDTLGYPLLVPTNNSKIYLHNQRLGKIIPVQEFVFPKYFYYMYFQDVKYRSFVVGSSSGATVKHTAPKKILAFKPILPPIDGILIKEFDEKVKLYFQNIDVLIQQNYFLKEGRNILLPRLMSGMIDVEQLETETVKA